MQKRVMGIEPTYLAWKASVLPLNYTRMIFKSGWQDSNLRPPGPKPGALAKLSHTPMYKIMYNVSQRMNNYILKPIHLSSTF